jgi:hypothetical protein
LEEIGTLWKALEAPSEKCNVKSGEAAKWRERKFGVQNEYARFNVSSNVRFDTRGETNQQPRR